MSEIPDEILYFKIVHEDVFRFFTEKQKHDYYYRAAKWTEHVYFKKPWPPEEMKYGYEEIV